MKNYTTSIVIPNYKRPELLARLLDSLAKAYWPETFKEVIVVENGGKSTNKEIVSGFKEALNLKYIFSNTPGGSPAKNLGVEQSDSDIIIFFDDDIAIEKETLTAYAETFQKYGLNHFYGGRLKADYETPPPDWLYELLPDCAKGFMLDHENAEESEYFLGANLAVPKKLFYEANGFDKYGPIGSSNSGFCGEETRLQKRLYEKGYRGIYVHNASVNHYVPKEHCSKEWLLKRRYRQGFGSTIEKVANKNSMTKIPPWVIRKLLTLKTESILNRVMIKKSSEQLKTEMSYHYYKGVVSAYLNRN